MADGRVDTKALRAEIGITHAEEKRIARSLSPSLAWPTLLLTMVLPATFVGVVYLGLQGVLALPLCTLVLGVISYSHYTLVHECVHGNIIAGRPGWSWIHTLIGWVGALGLGLSWPALLRTHLLHHSHTNGENDPDTFVKGTFVQLLRKWVINNTLSLIPMGLLQFISKGGYERLKGVFSPGDMAQITLVGVLNLVLFAYSAATGHLLQWFCLWFLPTRLGILLLNIFFQWLPHHPFDRTDRYGATRISLWPGAEVLTFQQNLHLVHHLWPSVPFYNYARLFKALRPVLAAEGSRIEGLMVGPGRRVIAN